MTKSINIAEAKAKLSALIDAALKGEDVILARSGTPLVRLVPLRQTSSKRLGIMNDLGWSGADVPFEAFEPRAEDAAIEDVAPGHRNDG